MNLLIAAWIVDGLIFVYLVQLIARMGLAWHGARSITLLIVLDLAAIAVSAALISNSQERWARNLALTIAGALPMLGAIGFLSVGLIAAITVLLGGRWN